MDMNMWTKAGILIVLMFLVLRYPIQSKPKKKIVLLAVGVLAFENIYQSLVLAPSTIVTSIVTSKTSSSSMVVISRLEGYHSHMEDSRNAPTITTTKNTTTLNGTWLVPHYQTYRDRTTQTQLVRTWKVHSASQTTNLDDLDANSCFPTTFHQYYRCLPSLYVIGFEKCGTTALMVWLSEHPHLQTYWQENRYFSQHAANIVTNLSHYWPDYLNTLPTIRPSQLGHVWTMEKSPSEVQNPFLLSILRQLTPSAKILLAVRNPTKRAYSHFLMYTKHYLTISSGVLRQPVSFFIKNQKTGDVRNIFDGLRDYSPQKKYKTKVPPGPVGSRVPAHQVPQPDQDWRYLDFPPDPADFDAFIRHEVRKHRKQRNWDDYLHKPLGRAQRILTGGLYGPYIHVWTNATGGGLGPQNVIVVPYESFFHPNAGLQSIQDLQATLGLPMESYKGLTKKDPKSGRYEIASLGTWFNDKFNSNGAKARPMLNTTRELLDDFYCASNQQLASFLGESATRRFLSGHGYSCIPDD